MRRGRWSRSPRSEAERRGTDNADRGGAHSLIIRNIPMDTNARHLRKAFRRFGPLTDVYVPRNKTEKPKGYAFVEFLDAKNASEAQVSMNFEKFRGNQINVDHATGSRRSRGEMRSRARISRGDYSDGSRRPYRGPQSHSHSYSWSRSPRYWDHHSRSYSPAPRHRGNKYISPCHSRSPGKRSHERSYSPASRRRGNNSFSPYYSRPPNKRSRERSYSPALRRRENNSFSPYYTRSPNKRSLDRSCSPARKRRRRGNKFIFPHNSRSHSPARRCGESNSVSPHYFRSPDRSLERLQPRGSSSRLPARNE